MGSEMEKMEGHSQGLCRAVCQAVRSRRNVEGALEVEEGHEEERDTASIHWFSIRPVRWHTSFIGSLFVDKVWAGSVQSMAQSQRCGVRARTQSQSGL